MTKAILAPEIVFALIAGMIFSYTIVHPENILPEDLLPGAQDKQLLMIYSPDVVSVALQLEPGRLLASGKPDAAIKKAYELAARKPHDVVANICAGNVLLQVGQLDEGFRLLKRAAALAPRSRYVRLNLAEKLFEKERYEEAIAQYRLISAGYPHWAKPRLVMADIYIATGKPAEAAEELKAALETEPGNFEARKLYGLALARAGKGQRGLDEYFQGIRTEQDQQGMPADIKQLQTVWGTLDRAVFQLQKELDLRPEDAGVKLRLARIYLFTGQTADAKRLLLEARKRAPKDPEVHRTLALLYCKLGEQNQAVSAFMNAVKIEMDKEKLREER